MPPARPFEMEEEIFFAIFFRSKFSFLVLMFFIGECYQVFSAVSNARGNGGTDGRFILQIITLFQLFSNLVRLVRVVFHVSLQILT